jgi:hypothetical protein
MPHEIWISDLYMPMSQHFNNGFENYTKAQRFSVFALSASLFLISLTQNAFSIDSAGDRQMESVLALLLGWLDITDGQFSWFANPCLIASWLFLYANNLKISTFWSFAALCFSVSFLFYRNILSDEAGHHSLIISHDAGYWLWLSSCGIMFLGNLFFYLKGFRNTVKPQISV